MTEPSLSLQRDALALINCRRASSLELQTNKRETTAEGVVYDDVSKYCYAREKRSGGSLFNHHIPARHFCFPLMRRMKKIIHPAAESTKPQWSERKVFSLMDVQQLQPRNSLLTHERRGIIYWCSASKKEKKKNKHDFSLRWHQGHQGFKRMTLHR